VAEIAEAEQAWRGNVSNRDTKPVVVGSSCRGVQTATLAGSRAGAFGNTELALHEKLISGSHSSVDHSGIGVER
jgi:hypothetical protein